MSDLKDFFGVGGTSGGGLAWSIATANTLGENGKGYLFDNSSAVHTLTLPASPAVGDTLAVGDLDGSFAEYPLTISRNGSLINGEAADLVLAADGQGVTLVYTGATLGWAVVSKTGASGGSIAKTASFNAYPGNRYLVTPAASTTVVATLPTAHRGTITFRLEDGTSSRKIAVDPTTDTIEGLAAGDRVIIDIANFAVSFTWDGAKWRVF